MLMKAINEALAMGSMVPDGATDDDLANEFAKLEEEAAALALAGTEPAKTPAVPEPTPAGLPAEPEAVPSAPP
ncbi:unnamed protein product [Effrenium voratum]|nr:unnamed protein product [Effrenium voratum]